MELLNSRVAAYSPESRLHRSQQSVASRIDRINELQKRIDLQQNKLANCLSANLEAVSSAIQQLLNKPS